MSLPLSRKQETGGPQGQETRDCEPVGLRQAPRRSLAAVGDLVELDIDVYHLVKGHKVLQRRKIVDEAEEGLNIVKA